MGGTTLIIRASTEVELERKIEAHKREAEFYGLVEERACLTEYDTIEKEWKAYLWLHS